MTKNSPASVEQEKGRQRLTLEALADVGAGQVIDHRAVLAWSDSLGTREDQRETKVPNGM